MSQLTREEHLIQKLCEIGEAMKKRLLILIEAGEETGCQMREEKNAIEAWEDIVDRTDYAWQKQLLSDPLADEDIPEFLKKQAP